MNAEIFIQRLRALETDLLTLSRLADRAAKGYEDFTLDAIHPVEGLGTAICHAIHAASEGITGAMLVLDSWEKIKEMCDDAAGHNGFDPDETK